MTWGDYGVLEGTSVGASWEGRAHALLTGRGVPLVPSSALNKAGYSRETGCGSGSGGCQPNTPSEPALLSALSEGSERKLNPLPAGGGDENSRLPLSSLSALSGAVDSSHQEPASAEGSPGVTPPGVAFPAAPLSAFPSPPTHRAGGRAHL